MNNKFKKYIGLFGGFLSAVPLLLETLNVVFE